MIAATRVWRRLRLGLNTLIGSRPGGFFIPYRHAGSVAPGPYPALEPLFAAAMPDMLLWLERIEGLGERLGSFAGPPPAPRWTQDWFPRLDGAALYTIVRHHRPGRVVEIGSGHSTRFIAQAVADGGFACTITCIDPEPRAAVAQLPVTLRRRLWSAADTDVTRELQAGDVLLIDFKPCRGTGQRRRSAAEHRAAGAGDGRAGAPARHLPARPVPGRLDLARLQRAGRRGLPPAGRRLCRAAGEPLSRHPSSIALGRRPRRSAALFPRCTGVQSLAGEAAGSARISEATLNRRRKRCPAGTGRSGPAAPS